MRHAFGLLPVLSVLLLSGAAEAAGPPVPAARPRAAPSPTPTRIPTPQAPPRVIETRRGIMPRERVRFSSRDLSFSRLINVEEVDLDRDGVSEVLVDGIGTVVKLPADAPTVGFVSRYRLPFESPLLAVLKKVGAEWKPLFIAHVPLRCGQSDDLSSCDQLLSFRIVRFRFDDRPQVVFQMLHPGETGLNETLALRLVKGKLEQTFSVSLPRASVAVSIDPNGIERRLAVDTFLSRELPDRYRSFTLRTFFTFGENRFRISADAPENPWTSDRSAIELSYWGLVHQSGFSSEIEKMRDRQRREPPDAWSLDPVEVVKKRYPDATRVRAGARGAGVCIVYFERPNNCQGHAFLYQPLREWEGEKTFWEIASLRGQKDFPFECLEEPPLFGH
ncbi:MAG: hypothetical protein ABI914_00150 [Acidobacteriota bacterium]